MSTASGLNYPVAMRFLSFYLAFVALPSSAHVINTPHFALPVDLRFTDFEWPVAQEFIQMVPFALDLISAYPVTPRSLLRWTGDRAGLANKSVRMVLAHAERSHDFIVSAQVLDPRTNHGSLIEQTSDDTTRLTIVVFMNRVAFDEEGQARPEAFGLFVLALAHELNGPVLGYLEDTEVDALKNLSAFVSAVVKSPRLDRMDPNTRGVLLNSYRTLRARDCGDGLEQPSGVKPTSH